jgi:thiol-disulfide isomerase/thioredoxin
MLRPHHYAIGAVVAVLAIGAFFLYGTGGEGVHEMPSPPAVLDKLRLTAPETDRRAEQRPERRRERAAGRPRAERRGGGQARIEATWEDAGGNRVNLSDYRGRFVVLNLWATWCAPCTTELPSLARAQAALAPDNVVVIAVDLEKHDAATVASFLKAHGAESLGIAIDNDLTLMRTFNAYGLPLTLLIDKQGREFARAFGPQKWDDPEAIAYIREVANATANPNPNADRRGGRRGGGRGGRGIGRALRHFGN